ncbi:sensor histidine kinase [Jongsikchunia kroppenstedtii]|uniref:sensor histidine kinase n=1 Tax=Jongsikchunia kroppenstedtii TaxID=1121721 RepID=UPI00037C15AD|nr:histidine kinase [Jongsikchunia kroppenstedtii]
MLLSYAHRHRDHVRRMGFDYPVAYLMLADAALVAATAAAVAERVYLGLHGVQWLLVILAGAVAISPLLISCIKTTRPWPHMLMVMALISVGIFWTMPSRQDLAPLILVVAGSMLAAILPPRRVVLDLLAATVMVEIGLAFDRVQQDVLIVTMIWFAGVVCALLRAQVLLLQNERQAHAAEVTLDRAAIAREVHDVVAHSLSIVLLNVTGARRALQDGDTEDALAALTDAEQQGRGAMSDIRRTIDLLRTDSDPGGPQPGLADLPALIETFRKAGTPIRFSVTDGMSDIDCTTADLTQATELAIYRIVQESLSNAARHASGAPVEATVQLTAATVRIVMRNPVGPGWHRSTGGLGVNGMRSRAEHLGGTLETSMTDDSWTVRAELPAPPLKRTTLKRATLERTTVGPADD